MSTLVLKGATIVDGTGAAPFPGNVYVSGNRILDIGNFASPAGSKTIDCSGLIVAPGFIDAHSHSDLQVLDNRPEKLLQGVTTELVGNCGFSPYPCNGRSAELREFANGIFCGNNSWSWTDFQSYGSEVRSKCRTGVLSLVGHGSLRVAYSGHQLGPLPDEVNRKMEEALESALEQGAAGLSTGLMYSPGSSAPPEELDRLSRIVARHDKLCTTHMRDYSDLLCEAVTEQIAIAQHTGCRLQISHLQAVGSRNWFRQADAIESIECAFAAGVDVAFDCYPYTRGATVLTQTLPQWTLEGGLPRLLARLSDAGERAKIALEMNQSLAQGWSGILIAGLRSAARQDLIGHSLEEIAERWHKEPAIVAFDLLLLECGAVNILEINQSEENLRRALTHPLSIVISDGFYVTGRPHPRLHGTFPYLLGEICRNRKWLSLAEAVHKITDKPAQRLGLRERGQVRRGYYADLTVFDEATVDSHATYENPSVPPVGIRHVFREGHALVRDGQLVANEVRD
jgi:dihydroorotase/N-acyl-D-amino-acid deacylase